MTVFKKNKEQTEKEVEVLGSLNHPGIVKLKEVVSTPRYFCIVMEILTGGELFDRIVSREKYGENDAKIVARELLEILQYLHDHTIVHRDLKPENLVFNRPGDDATMKLTDFGFATPTNPKLKLTATCGTPEYVAPEILNEEPYGVAVDMWSAGVILYILLCGFPPFYGDNDDELFERIATCNYKFISPYWDRVSEDAKNLIRGLLELNPKKRLTAAQALAHPWFGKQTTQNADLSGALNELRRYNATRKFRKGVLLILAANKLKVLIGGI
jgi:serine/threonine protein kinase